MSTVNTKKRPKKSVVILAIIGGIALITVVVTLIFMLGGSMDSETVDFDSGWTVDINGDVYENVSISDFVFPKMCGKGDEITLTNTLPDTGGISMSFGLLLYLSEVEIRVGDELRYTYGEGLYKSGGMLGSGYHYVPIRPWDGEKEIVVTVRPGEDNAFSSISDVSLVPAGDRVSVFARAYILTFFVSIFLVMLGFAILITSAITYMQGIKNNRLFHIGCFSFFIGIWSMCSDKLISLFSHYRELNTALEYLSLYLAVIPFISLIIDMRKDVAKWKRVTLRVARGVSVLFVVIALVFHFSGIAHFPAVLEIFHAMVALELVCLIVAAVKPFSKMNRADRFLNVGIFVFAVAGGVDVLRFNLQKFLLATTHGLDASVLPFGALVFMILLIMSYLVYMYDEMIMQTEKRTLERLAYEDPLTGLSNRTRSEERLAELSAGDKPYCIVGIDLNGLKTTNDTLGHANGDLLIETFGHILSNVFTDIGEAFRMGGDEFLVIIEEVNKNTIYTAMYQMEARCRGASEAHPFRVEAAYGVAFSDEADAHNAESVLKLADERMYDMKQMMKRKRDVEGEK